MLCIATAAIGICNSLLGRNLGYFTHGASLRLIHTCRSSLWILQWIVAFLQRDRNFLSLC